MQKPLSMSKTSARLIACPAWLPTTLMLATLALPDKVLAQMAPLPWRNDPVSNCSFVAPASLGTGTIYWTGACPDGKASGAGMLRRRDNGRTGGAFYGEMQAGVPRLGVVDYASGYRVGRFVNGDIEKRQPDTPARLEAFQAALRGARTVSAHFASVKNGSSADYYEGIAKLLEAQAK